MVASVGNSLRETNVCFYWTCVQVSDAYILFIDDWDRWMASRGGGVKVNPTWNQYQLELMNESTNQLSSTRDVVYLLDALRSPKARKAVCDELQAFHPDIVAKIRFYAETPLFVKDKFVGKLFLFDAQQRMEFTANDELLLQGFANTIAGLVDDEWKLEKEIQFNGVHMHQHILKILQYSIQSMSNDRDKLSVSLNNLKESSVHRSAKTIAMSSFKRDLFSMQRKFIFLQHIFGLAMGLVGIRVGASEMETQLQLLEETGKKEEIFTYSLNKHHWQESLSHLLTEHYAENSISTHFEHRFETGQYLIASDPDFLQFCVAVLVGHVFANVEKARNINVVMSMTKPMTGLRHFCIQISCGLRMEIPSDALQAALDAIVQQYFCGRCRFVTECCFQVLVPFIIGKRNVSIFRDRVNLADRVAGANAVVSSEKEADEVCAGAGIDSGPTHPGSGSGSGSGSSSDSKEHLAATDGRSASAAMVGGVDPSGPSLTSVVMISTPAADDDDDDNNNNNNNNDCHEAHVPERRLSPPPPSSEHSIRASADVPCLQGAAAAADDDDDHKGSNGTGTVSAPAKERTERPAISSSSSPSPSPSSSSSSYPVEAQDCTRKTVVRRVPQPPTSPAPSHSSILSNYRHQHAP